MSLRAERFFVLALGDLTLLTLIAASATHVPRDGRLLQLAAHHGHIDAVRFWLAHPGIDALSEGPAALYSAAAKDHAAVVELLLRSIPGLDVDAPQRGNTIVHHLAERNRLMLLRDLWPTIAKAGYTPLLLAVAGNHALMVDLLLDLGSDLNATLPSNGWGWLHIAACLGHMGLMQHIVAVHGASLASSQEATVSCIITGSLLS
ncbi:hypothetical protein ACHHYP_20668 [Achlya hypogyna]|uniref:Secreted protein n=1 Tax=Achlya hypogyna TaxID=1202772 RepID=A0A1V9YFJ9_ACHHY|nr:hypothetical protein ACHHYP_20668 [Achlya hypogyna]